MLQQCLRQQEQMRYLVLQMRRDIAPKVPTTEHLLPVCSTLLAAQHTPVYEPAPGTTVRMAQLFEPISVGSYNSVGASISENFFDDIDESCFAMTASPASPTE